MNRGAYRGVVLLGLPVLAVIAAGGAVPPISPIQPTLLHIGVVQSGESWLLPPTLMQDGPEAWVTRQVFGQGLMRQNQLTGAYEMTPMAANRQEGVRLGRVYYTLQPDIRFHDGTPLTLTDIRGTLNLLRRLARAGDPMVDPSFAYLDSVSTDLELNQIEIVMPPRMRDRADRIVSAVPLVPAFWGNPRASVDEIRATIIRPDSPTGLGAYRMRILDVGESRNGASLQIALTGVDRSIDGTPQIRDVVVHLYQRDEQLVTAFVTGEVQVAMLPTQLSMNALNALMSSDYILRSFSRRDHLWFLAFNNARGPLSNPEIRRAIALGLDRSELQDPRTSKDVLTDLPIHPDTRYGRHTLAVYQPRRALQTLTDMGFQRNREEILQRRGEVLKFELIYPDNVQLYEQIARYILNDLGKIDIAVEPVPLPPAEVRERLRTGQYQMALHEMTLPPTPEALYRLFHSSNSASGLNFTRYRQIGFESSMNAYLNLDIPDREQYLVGALNYLRDDLPLLPLFFQGSIYLAFDSTALNGASLGQINQELRPLVQWKWRRP